MSEFLSIPCTTFAGTRRIARGSLVDVALAIKAAETTTQGAILTFNDATGAVLDFDLRGTTAEIVTRLNEQGEHAARAASRPGAPPDGAARPRGRPKLGVVAREVTLLPRHWEWLERHPGGASQALRRLVDEARQKDGGTTSRKAVHERTYRFLSALAGNLPGYEDAIRALFAGDNDGFADRMRDWPTDVRDYALTLADIGQAPQGS